MFCPFTHKHPMDRKKKKGVETNHFQEKYFNGCCHSSPFHYNNHCLLSSSYDSRPSDRVWSHNDWDSVSRLCTTIP